MFRVFFFFKQKTAYEMRISDWSSDVCSSDLYSIPAGGDNPLLRQAGLQPGDVVLSVNGRAVEPARLGALKQALDGQSQATLRYRRGGTTHPTTVEAPHCTFNTTTHRPPTATAVTTSPHDAQSVQSESVLEAPLVPQ